MKSRLRFNLEFIQKAIELKSKPLLRFLEIYFGMILDLVSGFELYLVRKDLGNVALIDMSFM